MIFIIIFYRLLVLKKEAIASNLINYKIYCVCKAQAPSGTTAIVTIKSLLAIAL